MLLDGLDDLFARYLDSQVDDLVAVVGQDDVHQILANVMHVALDSREHDLAPSRPLLVFHVVLEEGHRRLHDLGALQHFGHDELVLVEKPPHLGHAHHERPVDDVHGLRPTRILESFGQVLREPFLRALHHRAGQALFEGKLGTRRGHHPGVLVPEILGELGHRLLTCRHIPQLEKDQRLGQAPLLLGYVRKAGQPLRVDEGGIEAGLGVVVQEDRVQDLATRHRQAEAHVGDSQHRPRQGELGVDLPHAFDGCSRGTDVVLVSGATREDQGIEPDVLRRKAHLFGQDLVAAPGDLELAFHAHRHADLVDHPDDDRGAERLSDRDHPVETGASFFEIDRVEDRFSLAPGQRLLHDLGVGRVDHQRHLHHSRELLQEPLHVGDLFTIRVLHADVDRLRPSPGLAPADLRCRFDLTFGDQALELAATQDVGSLADEQRAVVDGELDSLYA